MAFAGLFWTRSPFLVAGKTIVGLEVERHVSISGWPGDFMSERNQKKLEAKVSDLVVGLHDHVRENYQGSHTLGYLLTHRGRNCLPPSICKGGTSELEPLRRPSLHPHYEMVLDHLRRNKPITQDDVLQAMGAVVELKVEDKIGVYLRLEPSRDDVIYFGKAVEQSIASRSRGHSNATHVLWKAWLVNTPADIPKLEDLVHNSVQSRFGAERYKPTSKSKGLWKFPKGIDPVVAVESIMEDCHMFYHGTASWEQAYEEAQHEVEVGLTL